MAHYRMPAGCDTELWSLVKPLRVAMREQRLSYAELARRVRYDRSWVSRALAARDLPPRALIGKLAQVLGADVAAAERRWARNSARQRNARARGVVDGGPPPRLHGYAGLLSALAGLLQDRGISQRELARRCGLSRSTIGAVLRGERSAGLGVMTAIVCACGVSDLAVQQWANVWWRYGWPYQDACRRRQRAGYYQHMIGRAAP